MPSINAIADALQPDAQRKMLAAIRAMAQQVSIPALTKAIQDGNIGAALVAIKSVQFPAKLQPLAHTIEQTFTQAAIETMKPFVVVDPTFVKKDPLAQAAADWSGQKITQITDETRDAIRKLIRKGLTDGIEPKVLAKDIKPLVGLNARQATAVQNAKAAWLKSGLDPATVDAKGEVYTEKLRKYRAHMIARTETIGASNRGQLHGWRAGVKKGLLDPTLTKRKWIAAKGSGRTCPICTAMHGQLVPFHESFVSPQGKVVQHPPVHPNCRCSVGLEIEKSKSQLPKNFGQPEPPPELTPVPVVMPDAKDVEAEMHAQNAALEAAKQAKLADIKAKKQAYNKTYNAAYRAKKKAEKLAAKTAKPTVGSEAPFVSLDEFNRADAILQASTKGDARVDAKVKIMNDLSTRLSTSNASVQNMFGQKSSLAAMPKYQRDAWVSDRISTWAGTSGDHDTKAVAMQLAIRDEFDIHGADMAHFPQHVLTKALEDYKLNGEAYRAFAREMHNNTQQWFEQHGVTHVTLVRGANYGTKTAEGWTDIKLQPASSFAAGTEKTPGDYGMSSGIQTSITFGRTMHIVRVPVSQVLGTARTGFGCLSEHEYVLLGGNLRGVTLHAPGYGSAYNAEWERQIMNILKKGQP